LGLSNAKTTFVSSKYITLTEARKGRAVEPSLWEEQEFPHVPHRRAAVP
jgi:hypothetical protein